MKSRKNLFIIFGITVLLISMFCVTAYAAGSDDMAGAIEGAWN